MGSRCPTLRKSPSTLPHRRAFWGFRGEWGAVPTRIDGVERAAFALLFCARASFSTVGGRIYDKRSRRGSSASETAGNRQRVARNVARNVARRCVFRRVCLHGASHAAPELARWTQKTPLLFRKSWGISRKSSGVFGVCCGARSKTGDGRRNKCERRARIRVSAATTCSLANR